MKSFAINALIFAAAMAWAVGMFVTGIELLIFFPDEVAAIAAFFGHPI